MERTPLQEILLEFPIGCDIKCNEPLSKHTSFRIGGNAEIMAFPDSREALRNVLAWCAERECDCRILGAGTNVLAPDAGVPGVTVCLKDAMDGMELLEDGKIRIMSGVTMSRAAVFAANHGLTGMEFAHGIPGTVGGGVYMNAGAYGGEIGGICHSVEVMDRHGNIRELTREQMDFSYRHSVLEGSGDIVISAVFCLEQGNTEAIRSRMKELMSKRSSSQPLDLPSAGSAFKRPKEGYASKLIDEAGLRGYQVGGAAVSVKHTGFAVNLGGATAEDVKNLLSQVAQIVNEKFGIMLEPEIRIW